MIFRFITNKRFFLCKALGNMGEKVATDEVIMKLLKMSSKNYSYLAWTADQAVSKILDSPSISAKLDRIMLAKFHLVERDADILKTFSEEQLVNLWTKSACDGLRSVVADSLYL
jgi:hypothetical protein